MIFRAANYLSNGTKNDKLKQEKEALRDIVNEAKDSLGIPPKILNGLVAERMNPGSIEERQNDLEEICGFAEGLGIKDTE